ncbi:MAG TPA: penicillin-binding protein 2 [Gammaproteobacteria bacterium]|nr:penicillin-binding protein 2 [Gammaproteobacteria bacterium]
MHLPCFGRYWFACFLIVLAFSATIIKLYQLTIHDRGFLVTESNKRSQRVLDVKAHRGFIFDRNHKVLAVNDPKYALWSDPSKQTLSTEAVQKLSKLLDTNVKSIQNKLSSKKQFVYLKRQVNAKVVEDLKSLKIPGINFQKEFSRLYPLQDASSQLIGMVNIDNHGLEGIELMYNDILKSHNGKKDVVIDVFGNVISEKKANPPAKSGRDIVLTIDRELQFVFYQKLKEAVIRHNAESASALLVHVPSGEILAATSYPSFHPKKKSFQHHRNLIFSDLFEPGSTFKPIFMSAILDAGYDDSIKVDTSRGELNIGHFKIKDVAKTKVLNLTGIISKSSNVGMSKLALQLDGKRVYELLRDFGLEMPSYIGYPGEQSGKLPKTIAKHKAVRAAASFGYGLKLTLVELVRAYTILANQGNWVDLKLVRSVEHSNNKSVIKAKHARKIIEMLHEVTTKKGTGHLARIKGVEIAGKTGTTNLVINGKYDPKRYESSFIGMAPYPNPQFILAIIVKDPKIEGHFGGRVAAPVFSTCMQHALSQFNASDKTTRGLQS